MLVENSEKARQSLPTEVPGEAERSEKTASFVGPDAFPVFPPSYEYSALPHPDSLGLFPSWAQHHDEQKIKLHAKIGFSSKVFATDEATGITILQWKSLTHICTRGFVPNVFLVENARTNEPLLKVCQATRSLAFRGNWTIRHPHTDEVIWEMSRPLLALSGRRNISVRFNNTAAGPKAAPLDLNFHRHFFNPKWELQMPDGSIKGVVQEPLLTYRAVVTVPPYVDTLFLVTLALIGREDDKAETSAAESAAASGS